MNKKTIKINLSKKIGLIKPMHCGNNIPCFDNEKTDKYMECLHVPYTRLHDSIYIQPKLVDISVIFPNFDADERLESSYDFAFTDYFIAKIQSLGIKIFYRLGVSIENYRKIKAYNIYPPKDILKWAKICEHVIMHFNEGWANGFHYNIEYWEIWNEPDNFPSIDDNQMWLGSKEDFYKLYQVSASFLKCKFPNLKIGGYASCGFYAVAQKEANKNANVSSRTDYFVDFFDGFLDYITDKDHLAPLDFFSWHSYGDVYSNLIYADYVRKKLNDKGFFNTESILNEWNPSVRLRGTLQDSSNVCANMIALNDAKVDMLMYYDFRICDYCSLFNPINYEPFPTYYIFKFFSSLYDNKVEVFSESSDNKVFSLCSYNDSKGFLLITNNDNKKANLKLEGIVNIKNTTILTKNLTKTIEISNNEFSMLGYETALIEF